MQATLADHINHAVLSMIPAIQRPSAAHHGEARFLGAEVMSATVSVNATNTVQCVGFAVQGGNRPSEVEGWVFGT